MSRGRRVLAALILTLVPSLLAAEAPPASPEALRKLASGYYRWRNEQYPVAASDQGLHAGDARLTDWSAAAVAARREHVRGVLDAVRGAKTAAWTRDDRIDAVLFHAQLEGVDLFDRFLSFPETNPGLYVEECSSAIFSLLKKDYAPARVRALAAASRLEKMPALLAEARKNLTRPVALHARLAIQSARQMDGLFTDSLMTLAGDLSAGERARLVTARDRALSALNAFADSLEKDVPKMVAFAPMGEASYDELLRRVYLLPIDAKELAMLGDVELARFRALEALLADPSMADPDPARAAHVPKDQEGFLKAYESRQAEMIRFLKEKRLVTLPPSLGAFRIRQLPEAFKPTSPGGFMNAPGLYDADSGGFYFIPTYDPRSRNFYIRAAIEDPRPILGHEGIPGHFLQISISNALANEIRREHGDGVFIEGWALYGEEMLMRQGLYAEGSAGQGQVLRLARYRAARIGVDVNLHTGRWTFDDAVRSFMEAGGLDREAAEGEAAGAAASPTQKMTYMTGKWQILRLLGKWREKKGAAFRLGEFHDALLAHGSLPLSVVEWILFDDPSSVEKALGGLGR
ncbi:MAG: DUF885 domain-containing protein [Thermoanaerobaculia bacterium]